MDSGSIEDLVSNYYNNSHGSEKKFYDAILNLAKHKDMYYASLAKKYYRKLSNEEQRRAQFIVEAFSYVFDDH